MMIQPRTLITTIISGAVIIVGALVYFIFFHPSGAPNETGSPSTTLAITTDTQVVKTSLYDLAVLANIARSAYDQKSAATEKDPDADPKTVCDELFKDTDLSLLAQALSVDIDQKIDEVVSQKQVLESTWADCAKSCTCSTLATLLDKGVEAKERVEPSVLEAAQASAEALTTKDAIKCAEAVPEVCQTPLAKKYAEQAADVE